MLGCDYGQEEFNYPRVSRPTAQGDCVCKEAKLRPFDGNEEIFLWLAQAERVRRMNRWDWRTLVHQTLANLSGEAAKWWDLEVAPQRGRNPENIEWRELCYLMQKRFVPFFPDSQLGMAYRTPQDKRTVSSYAADLRKAFQSYPGLPEFEKLKVFLHNLRPELYRDLRIVLATSFEAAVLIAQATEKVSNFEKAKSFRDYDESLRNNSMAWLFIEVLAKIKKGSNYQQTLLMMATAFEGAFDNALQAELFAKEHLGQEDDIIMLVESGKLDDAVRAWKEEKTGWQKICENNDLIVDSIVKYHVSQEGEIDRMFNTKIQKLDEQYNLEMRRIEEERETLAQTRRASKEVLRRSCGFKEQSAHVKRAARKVFEREASGSRVSFDEWAEKWWVKHQGRFLVECIAENFRVPDIFECLQELQAAANFQEIQAARNPPEVEAVQNPQEIKAARNGTQPL